MLDMKACARMVGYIELLLRQKFGADANKVNTSTGETPLLVASRDGRIEFARMLLDRDADPNKQNTVSGSTPLTIATWKGHLDIMTLLLDRGADLNKPNSISEDERMMWGFIPDGGRTL